MNSVVATLFEGHYHHGVAALTNSLYKAGYRGDIYAGFRGSLPDWSSEATNNLSLTWKDAKILKVAEALNIHLLPLDTHYHLTNYKPDFMLRILELVPAEVPGIIYFDPDIIIKCKWNYFENWITHGVALVHEVISNDMPPTHPLRKEWEKVISKSGKSKMRELYSYFNGGFCGVSKENIEFLHAWVEIFNTGIKYFNLTADQWRHQYDRSYVFYAQDQDALNITAMCSNSPISEMGPEAMDFIQGGNVMSHAVGSSKPWRKNFFKALIKGYPPSLVDKYFWINANSPISFYKPNYIKLKNYSIMIASFIGRFYRRY